jgi:hypothetical protein
MELQSIGTWVAQHPVKFFGFLIFILVFAWLLGSTILVLMAPKFVYNRAASFGVTPDVLYEQLWLKDDHERTIDTVWIPNSKATQIVLYLHGNRGRLNHFFPALTEKYSVLAPAYPGYHESTGSPSTKSIYNTAVFAYDYLIAQGFSQEQIIIFGHSMGGSPAVYLASERPDAGKLVLLNTFYNFYDMCWMDWNILCTFTKPILNTARYAPIVHNKVRQYHFIDDPVIPYSQGEKLFKRFTGTQDKKFITLDGELSHSDLDVLEAVSGE